jgi:hypothetical protein
VTREIAVSVEVGDALRYACDVLVLKHAQALYGVDAAVVTALQGIGQDVGEDLPRPGSARLVMSNGAVAASRALFVGVPTQHRFDYLSVREFAYHALEKLSQAHITARHIALTLQGPGFGLDESEAFRAELAGLVDAIAVNHMPRDLDRIVFVEMNPGRAARMVSVLETTLPSGVIQVGGDHSAGTATTQVQSTLADVGHAPKPHVFVAMPFAAEFDDRYHYGIERATHAAGFLCERADLATFTGDVIDWVRRRIDTAAYVIADLTAANANVYLEVGYAWGRGIPTILLVSDDKDLKFDTRGQRCLVYKNSIRQLEELLNKELVALAKT